MRGLARGTDFVLQGDMVIDLTPEQETWIKARVAAGDFPSVEDAVRQLIDDRIAELAQEVDEHDDMAWAKPLVDEGLAAFERGEFIRSDPWIVTLPGLAILVTVVAINLTGDGLRDALDPKMRRG